MLRSVMSRPCPLSGGIRWTMTPAVPWLKRAVRPPAPVHNKTALYAIVFGQTLHARTHARTNARTHARTHARTPARTHARTQTHTHIHTHTDTHTYTQTHTHAFTNIVTRARAHTHACWPLTLCSTKSVLRSFTREREALDTSGRMGRVMSITNACQHHQTADRVWVYPDQAGRD